MPTNNVDIEEMPEFFILSKKKNGKIFCPEKIPRKRYGTKTWLTSFVIMICFICFSWLKGLNTTLNLIGYGLGAIVFEELLFRLVLLVEEFRYHLKSRYLDHKTLLKHVFSFPWHVLMIMPFWFLIYIFGKDIFQFDHSFCFLIVGLLLMKRLIYLEDAPIYRSLKIEEKDGLNYGSGMAYAFFHGYLRLILPKKGTKEKNLIEEIEIYSDSQGVKFTVPKLFILIPRSCFCHVSLKDGKFPDIEECESLGEIMKTIAAVQKRVYKNSVYKVYDKVKKEKLYVCCEYATPLRTFQKGLEHDGPHTEYFKAHKPDIVLQFYSTLKMLVENDHEVRDHCELIYYDDYDEDKEEYRDVAKIIVKTIRKIEKDKKNR